MRKHKWKLLGAVALALIVVAVLAVRPRPDRVTRENYRRIQPRMSRAEVEAILGPPGDYRTGPSEWKRPKYGHYHTGPREDSDESDLAWRVLLAAEDLRISRPLVWRGDYIWIYVSFGPHGACDRYMDPASPREQGGFEKLQWRLRRQWRQWFPADDQAGTLDD